MPFDLYKNMQLHRNSQKRYYLKDTVYFITTNTYQGLEYFKEPILCDLLIENLRICKELKQFSLYAFCVLYNHVHLLLKPENKYNISKIMQNLKMNTARNINKIINHKQIEGENTYSRLRLNKYYQQSIQIYDKNQIIITKFIWQQSYHDHIIRNYCDLENHYRYTADNFQKHGLPMDWLYTSLNYPDLIDLTS